MHGCDIDKATLLVEAMHAERSIRLFVISWMDVTWRVLDVGDLVKREPNVNPVNMYASMLQLSNGGTKIVVELDNLEIVLLHVV